MSLLLDHLCYQVNGLYFHYHAEIEKGITGIFGPSGAGKTTLINMICGVVRPQSGLLAFDDTVLFDHSRQVNRPAQQRRMGVVFQDHYLFPHLTVRQNLNYSRPYVRRERQMISFEAVTALLDLDALLDKKSFQLSGGERQRVAIGRALLAQPRLLLLDEPFSNLDKPRRMQIISYLLKIHNQFQLPMLIISHDLDDMLKLTSALVVIKDRSIVTTGPYLDMVEKGSAPDLISPKHYLNMIELCHFHYAVQEDLHLFGPRATSTRGVLKTNAALLTPAIRPGTRVRLCIYPDEIALTAKPVCTSSIQNQLQGRIEKLFCQGQSCFVTLECGFPLVAEITPAAGNSMNLKLGDTIYALIKAKAIHVLHVYDGRPRKEVPGSTPPFNLARPFHDQPSNEVSSPSEKDHPPIALNNH